MKKIFLSALSFISIVVHAQTGVYSLAAVPENLKTKASVITHVVNINVEVESLEKATETVHKIFTVVNEEGRDALLFNQHSNKYYALTDAEIRIYDQKGKLVEKVKKKDMITTAVGEGLIEDGYVTFYQVKGYAYPITIEFNYEHRLKSTLFFPDYRFIQRKEAVLESNYIAKVPSNLALRYKGRHTSLEPTVTEQGAYTTYKWAVKSQAAIEDEEGSESFRDKFPYVEIVPAQFSHYGYTGDFSSWKSFGFWIQELYKGLDELPADRQQFFQKLVNDAGDEKEKIRRLYQYLQENFRYVSIQLGIGGLKPFSASFTDQKKYGDCKALSNFMKAALKAVGVKSYVAIINSAYNGEPVDADFPANNFNHVILCVPREKDSVWLECTSSTAAFGKLSSATENRNALLITDDGGVLVATPKSEASTNYFSSKTIINVQSDFSARSETLLTTSGAYTEMLTDLLKEKRDEQKEVIVSSWGYRQPDDFEFASTNNKNEAKLTLVIRKVSEFNSGSKHFLKPRIHKMWSSRLPASEIRKMDFYFFFPFEKRDTTIMILTNDLEVDVLPAEKEFKTAYSYYHSRSWLNKPENAIYTATMFTLKKHKVLAADYSAVRSFFDEVLQDDMQRIVVKNTGVTANEKKT